MDKALEFVRHSWDKCIAICAGITGAVAGLLGGFDKMLSVLVIFMVADYVTGWIVAILGHSLKTESGHLNSQVGAKGIAKKCFILLMVLLANALDTVLETNAVFRSMVIWFYVANEGLSIIENAALAGFPFPQGLKNVLEQIKKRNDQPPDMGIVDHEGFTELHEQDQEQNEE